jgi:hypothetical protein
MGQILHVYRPGDGAAFLGTNDVAGVIGAVIKAGLDLDLGTAPDDGTPCQRIGVVALAATPVEDAEIYRVKRADAAVAKPDIGRAPDAAQGKWVVQSLIFDQATFTEAQARTWVDTHEGFGNHGVDATSQSYRFRQYDPQHFDTFRVQPFAPGITAVLGRVKAAEDAGTEGAAKAAAEVAAWTRDVQGINARIRAKGLRALPLAEACKPKKPKDEEKDEERYILGLVLEPNDGDGAPLKPDTQNDVYSSDDIRKTAHGWMERYGQIDLGHSWEPLASGQVRILESYLAPCDFDVTDEAGNASYHVVKGTWLLALRVLDDAIWEAIKAGEIGAYSVGGLATPEPFTPPAGE